MQAMFELCRRFCLSSTTKVDNICSSVELAHRLMNEMTEYLQEHFVLITLDTKNQIIKQHTLFIGTLNQSIAHPRDVFRQAAADNAACFIIAHNHPCGDTITYYRYQNISDKKKQYSSEHCFFLYLLLPHRSYHLVLDQSV